MKAGLPWMALRKTKAWGRDSCVQPCWGLSSGLQQAKVPKYARPNRIHLRKGTGDRRYWETGEDSNVLSWRQEPASQSCRNSNGLYKD